MLPALLFDVSRNLEDRIMVRFAKWRARESFVCIFVSGVKMVQSSFPSGCTFNMLIEMRKNVFMFFCINVPGY